MTDEDERHRDHREKLFDAREEVLASYVKTLISLSSGAFVVSVTFLADVLTRVTPWGRLLIYASWVSFSACIVALVLMMRKSDQAYEVAIKQADQRINGKETDEKARHQAAKPVACLLRFAGISFIAGVVAMLAFALTSLPTEEKEMTQETAPCLVEGEGQRPRPEPPPPPPAPRREVPDPLRKDEHYIPREPPPSPSPPPTQPDPPPAPPDKGE